jgi:hypothetical protein
VALLVVLWPRSPLARDERPRATVVETPRRPSHGTHAARSARTVVFSHATPDGPRIKMVIGHDE